MAHVNIIKEAVVLFTSCCWNGQFKEDWMGDECNTHGRDKILIHSLVLEDP
jgi:hypothetical protein